MSRLAIIGGSGFSAMGGLQVLGQEQPDTPYGPPSAPVVRGLLGDVELLFLPRHGDSHGIPPHLVPNRANIWALRACGAERVVGLAAVGGIDSIYAPCVFAVPDQIIDYTHGRANSFYEGGKDKVLHIDFTPIARACASHCSVRRMMSSSMWWTVGPTA